MSTNPRCSTRYPRAAARPSFPARLPAHPAPFTPPSPLDFFSSSITSLTFSFSVSSISSFSSPSSPLSTDFPCQVHEHLQQGGTIGIFPEGGTHDGTNLLPLKWGVSTMVLGALAKYEGKQPLKISIVPVGLNYFAPHKFRSTVSVDFGDAIEISESLVEKYRNGSKEDKQEANREVMELVMLGVRSCTLLVRGEEGGRARSKGEFVKRKLREVGKVRKEGNTRVTRGD
eukprot:753500-Hanusia_phi.AAC.5